MDNTEVENNKEVEKKFLIVNDGWKKHTIQGEIITQTYIEEDGIKKRVRVVNGKIGILTVKGDTTIENGFLVRSEKEEFIPLMQAAKKMAGNPLLLKHRYILNVGLEVDGQFFPMIIDEFTNLEHKLVMAEIEIPYELLNKVDMNKFKNMPDWVGEDVTENPEYANSKLIEKSKKDKKLFKMPKKKSK